MDHSLSLPKDHPAAKHVPHLEHHHALHYSARTEIGILAFEEREGYPNVRALPYEDAIAVGVAVARGLAPWYAVAITSKGLIRAVRVPDSDRGGDVPNWNYDCDIVSTADGRSWWIQAEIDLDNTPPEMFRRPERYHLVSTRAGRVTNEDPAERARHLLTSVQYHCWKSWLPAKSKAGTDYTLPGSCID